MSVPVEPYALRPAYVLREVPSIRYIIVKLYDSKGELPK
jgi:hypothetical protein